MQHNTSLKNLEKTVDVLSSSKFNLSTEALLKVEMKSKLHAAGLPFEEEFVLDQKNRPDFFLDGVAIEVKIKGAPKSIFKQCSRYCEFEKVAALILVTNRTMGFPKDINNKPCYVVNLGRAWL